MNGLSPERITQIGSSKSNMKFKVTAGEVEIYKEALDHWPVLNSSHTATGGTQLGSWNWAFACMLEGGRVRRPDWKTTSYIYICNGRIWGVVQERKFPFGPIQQALIFATDWQIVEESK